MTPWLHSGRIPGLDGLRAVAVLLVVVAHASQTAGFPLPSKWWKVGAVGVDVFFVLSGFLITALLCRDRMARGSVSIGGFYLRRSLRILPALIAYLVFVAALAAAGLVSTSPADWRTACTFTVNFRDRPAWELGHLWSLSIEEHFYLVWPVLFAFLPRRISVWVAAAPLLLCPTLRWAVILFRPDWTPFTDLWTPTRLDHIAAGSLMALIAQRVAGTRILSRLARWWPLALALAVAAVVGGQLSGKVAAGLTPTVTALCIAVLVWASAQTAPRWLEWKPVAWVGTLSYSLYLWQQPFLRPDGPHWFQSFPLNLSLAVTGAVACHYLVERPFLRLKPGPKPPSPSRTVEPSPA